jgi:putative nucleic acid binding protein
MGGGWLPPAAKHTTVAHQREDALMRTQAFALILLACPLLAAADPKDEKPLAVTADQLIQEFQDDKDAAANKYAGKTIEVTGTFYQYGDIEIRLRGKSDKLFIQCNMPSAEVEKLEKDKVPTETTTLTVQGRDPGIVGDAVEMVKCKIVKVKK